ncbi:hypothetical protein [Nonomuraea sp. NPDC049309]|uniref:hypothetical protein n=1 Tax=Nonomuraea sp. NPDC049309 TaxID=3364350 RepID=UPI003720C645
MFSRSKRIFGIAALALAAVGIAAAPAHADDDELTGFNLLRDLRHPLCLPSAGVTGIPIVDSLLPEVIACGRAIEVR